MEKSLKEVIDASLTKAALKKLCWFSYFLTASVLFMINESTSLPQWLIAGLIFLATLLIFLTYIYLTSVREKRWLALTLTEIFIILTMSVLFIFGALESSKLYAGKLKLIPLLLSVCGIFFYVYLETFGRKNSEVKNPTKTD